MDKPSKIESKFCDRETIGTPTNMKRRNLPTWVAQRGVSRDPLANATGPQCGNFSGGCMRLDICFIENLEMRKFNLKPPYSSSNVTNQLPNTPITPQIALTVGISDV